MEFTNHWEPVAGGLVHAPFDQFRKEAKRLLVVRSETVTEAFGSYTSSDIMSFEKNMVSLNVRSLSPSHIGTNRIS